MRYLILCAFTTLFASGCCNTPYATLDNVDRIDMLSAQMKDQYKETVADIERFKKPPFTRIDVDFAAWERLRQETADVITYLKVRRRVVMGERLFDPDHPTRFEIKTSD